MHTNANDNTKLITVFNVNPSPINKLAHIAKVNIPAANPINLAGQINSSNAIKPYLVASIYNQLIGTPNKQSIKALFLNQGIKN